MRQEFEQEYLQLGLKIAYYRKLRGLTQEELALRSGVSRQTIMSIERGQTNPSALLALKIAAVFKVPVTDVFYMEGELAPV